MPNYITDRQARKDGLLSENFSLRNPPKSKATVIRCFRDYKKTNYPGRPVTRQYLEMLEIAKQFNINITEKEVTNA